MQVELPFLPESTDWLARLRTDGKSTSTLQCYARDLRHVSIAMGSNETSFLVAADQQVVDRIAKCWSTTAASSGTVQQRFSALRGFAKFLLGNKSYDCSRLLSLKYPAVTRIGSPVLRRDDIDLILTPISCAPQWSSLRDLAVLRLQGHNGLTVAETVSLNLRDANGDYLRVRATAFRARTIELDADTARLIQRYLRAKPFPSSPDGPLFVNGGGCRLSQRSVQLMFLRRRLECGLQQFDGPSCLRRSLGVQLATEGHPLNSIADLLGISAGSACRLFSGRAY
jgi:site-specific recombinase XerD